MLNVRNPDMPRDNSPQVCGNLCYEKGFNYVGLQNKRECFCGNKMRNYRKKQQRDWDQMCPGNCTCHFENKLSSLTEGNDQNLTFCKKELIALTKSPKFTWIDIMSLHRKCVCFYCYWRQYLIASWWLTFLLLSFIKKLPRSMNKI